ncbi:flavin-containing monooxygenase [Gordonia rubripertincta]|uniref:NAD(P)-binding domain-containing protein n=1 Tax=Gordonia rubripertincta TaxID=36822 RepID=A0ABT4MXW0_GORRU|nr:NAD(P)-binding domain-containing protein [Gordonia rubripertincta]MCZ4551056.1 NAD(P)-binding domain-containing protein [Gordonia rubripertincta]
MTQTFDRTHDDGSDGVDPSGSDLQAALKEANLPSLLMALRQLTGDPKWSRPPFEPARPRGLDDNDDGGFPPGIQNEIRDAAFAAILDYRAGLTHATSPTEQEVTSMLAISLGEDVPDSYGPLLAEEFGATSRDVEVPKASTGFHVLIIGAGISGLCAAIKLKSQNVPFTILEKNDEVGGTWLENTYPGCGVDTPGHLYCFSFDPNTEWTRYFAKRGEVWSYLDRLTDKYAVREHIRFNTEVQKAEFDEKVGAWHVVARNQDGSIANYEGTILVPAVGMVNRPASPDIEGLDRFAGPVMHTAEWDNSVDLTDKRIAVIGTGASAMQLVPSVVDIASRVAVFQRSKQWAVPHPNYQREVSENVRLLMREVPFYAQSYRLRAFWNFSDRLHPQVQVDPDWPHKDRSVNAANDSHRRYLTRYIEEQLVDRPDLIEACLPDYPPYGKRPLIDNGWFAAVQRDDVDLVTSHVARVEPDSIVTEDGHEYGADVIVLATGFRTLQFLWPMEIRGRSGKTLAESWGRDDARAFLGVTVPDFPNMFILNGPNTNAGHGGSAFIATELQVRYFMQAVREMIDQDLDNVEVREDVFWDYNKELDEALSKSIWAHPGMTNWYRNAAGRVVVSSPWKYLDYWSRTREFDKADYVERKSSNATCARQPSP